MAPGMGLLAAGILLASGVLLLDRLAVRMIRPPLKPLRRKASDLPYFCGAHPFNSNGQALKGWILQPEQITRTPILIMVHGWGSNHGTMTRLAQPMLARGYAVFLFDVRYHGESRDASYVTARHFRDDILAAIAEVESRFPGRPRVLVGHSMGGSTAVLAAADCSVARSAVGAGPGAAIPEAGRAGEGDSGAAISGSGRAGEGDPGARTLGTDRTGVDALVTIAAPGDLWDVWAYHFDRRGLPGRWVVRAMRPFWRLRTGVPFSVLDPISRGSEVGVPVLLFHGSADESVKVDQASILSEALGVRPEILEGLGHSNLLEDPQLHLKLVDFLEEEFPTGSESPLRPLEGPG